MSKKVPLGEDSDISESTKLKNIPPRKLTFVSPLPLKNASLHIISSTIEKKRSPRSPRKTGFKEPKSARAESPKKKSDQTHSSQTHRHEDSLFTAHQQLIQELQQYQQQMEQVSPLNSPHSNQPLITTPPPQQRSSSIVMESSKTTPSPPAELTLAQKSLQQTPVQMSRRRSSSSPQNVLRVSANGKLAPGTFKLRNPPPELSNNLLPKTAENISNNPNNNVSNNISQQNITSLKKPEEGDSFEPHTPTSSRVKQFSFMALKNHTLDERELFRHFKYKEHEFADTRDAVSPFRYIRPKVQSFSTSTTPRHSISRSSTPSIDMVSCLK